MQDKPSDAEPKLRMLIIDDEMPLGKGYEWIEENFPGVFRIDQARRWNHDDVPLAERAMIKLIQQRYDVILLDFVFEAEKVSGQEVKISGTEIIEYIRKGITCVGGISAQEGTQNRDSYVIGVSNNWGQEDFGAATEMLDAYTGQGRTDTVGLFEEIRLFLERNRRKMTRQTEGGKWLDARITRRPPPPKAEDQRLAKLKIKG